MGLARLAALARQGLIQTGSGEEFHLRPENAPVLALWGQVQTQWRHGMAGPTGLDYQGVRASPAFRRIDAADREDLFEGVCIMERAWLAKRAEINKQEREQRS